MRKNEYERIQLLATPDIYEWWTKLQEEDRVNGTKLAQEHLREAVRIGMSVKIGEKKCLPADRAELLESIDKLLLSGRLHSLIGPTEVRTQHEKRRPNIDILKRSINQHRG